MFKKISKMTMLSATRVRLKRITQNGRIKMDNTQTFLDALSKFGIDMLPFAKVLAIGYVVAQVVIFVLCLVVFCLILYKFFKDGFFS
jgi:hypothetical protein